MLGLSGLRLVASRSRSGWRGHTVCVAEPGLISAKPFLTAAWRLAPWAAQHPFVLRPAFWALSLAGCMFVLATLVVAGVASGVVYGALSVALVVIVAGLWGWRRLVQPSDRTLVFLCRFAATAGDAAWAERQLAAVSERLDMEPAADYLEVRVLPAPVTADHAIVLIEETPAKAVVFGNVRTGPETARWETEMLVSWPGDNPRFDTHIEGAELEFFDRKTQPAPRHEREIDAQAPLAHLADERFEADHADHIEGTLLTLAAAASDDAEHSLQAVTAAEAYRAAVSPRTRAALEIARALATDEPLGAVLGRLERAGHGDADHADLWNFAAALSYFEGEKSRQWARQRLRFSEQAVRAAPDNSTARYNLAEALMTAGQPERALRELERVAQDDAYRDRHYVHLGCGILSYNFGRFERALPYYQRAAELRDTARVRLYLGDTYRQLGDEMAARREYLAALHRDPTLVDAHRGYWYRLDDETVPSLWYDRLLGPLVSWSDGWDSAWRRRLVRPIIWRLTRWHYRRHPEDSRVHYILGATALLRGDFVFAEERLKFAVKLIPVDIQARARLAVARGLQGRLEAAKTELVTIARAPRLPGTPDDPGFPLQLPDSKEARVFEVWMPFLDEPKLFWRNQENGVALEGLVEEVFDLHPLEADTEPPS